MSIPVTAPMPGKISRVTATTGMEVAENAELLVMEAMKTDLSNGHRCNG